MRDKIQALHLKRRAYVYIRQSSLKQVRENVESRRRQYGFADQARALGWSEGQIVILDEDQGRSGATPQARPGFAREVVLEALREPLFSYLFQAVLAAARDGSPLIIGVGEGEYVVASDASAIIEHTTNVIYLEDREMATLRRDGLRTATIDRSHSACGPAG